MADVQPQQQEGAEWDVKVLESNEKAWSEKNGAERALTVLVWLLKVTLVLVLLYLFIIALGLMGNAFLILGGKTAGETFRNAEIFDNPFAGLVIGILATVLVQSSSTSTSIIISMTASHLIEVDNSIPMIMGANIGTSVTNTIVSLGHIGKKDEYRRAFAGATVHDCFNLLTVTILLPIEAITHVIRRIATEIADGVLEEDPDKASKQDFLKEITKPVSKRIVQVDKKIVTKVAEAKDQATLDKYMKASMLVQGKTKEAHLFMDTPISDDPAGVLLLVTSLLLLTVCLALLVKLLQTIFRGRAAIWMQSLLNLEFKSVPFVADYILLLFGVGITILMQSSSITTSTLTPLVGVGLVKLDKMFPFTVGANIGTCVTGIMSALASSDIHEGMRVALSHLLFNLIGTLMWFPIPWIRGIPINMAKFLGCLAADMRWFPLAYIVFVFIAMPAILLGLSLAGTGVFIVVACIFLFILVGVIVLVWMRYRMPDRLPEKLRADPSWLPDSLRVTPAAQDEANMGGTGSGPQSADLDSATAWHLAPVAWGVTWMVLIALVLAIPNAQWGKLKYPAFEDVNDLGRDHVGVGAWSMCSAQFEADMNYTSAPTTCVASALSACWTTTIGTECAQAGFADQDGSNAVYEESWSNCTEQLACTPEQWGDYCKSMSCGGGAHVEQCDNVTEAMSQSFTADYSRATQMAWAAGDKCRPLSDFCDNSGSLGAAGAMAWVSFIFVAIGQFLLLLYVFMRQKRDMSKVLMGTCGCFILGWLLLLVTIIIFSSAVDGDTKCTVLDVATRQAVVATGKFGDIINLRGSYSFGCVCGSFGLMTAVIGIIVARVVYDIQNPWTEEKAPVADSPAVVSTDI